MDLVTQVPTPMSFIGQSLRKATATISVKEAVLAPKPIVAMRLLHRGGLSFTSARDQRSHVLTMCTQNAIRSPQNDDSAEDTGNDVAHKRLQSDPQLLLNRN